MKKTAIHRYLIALHSPTAPAAENAGEPAMTATVMLPPGAIIRAWGVSGHGINLFCQVNPDEEATEPRTFRFLRTGEAVEAATAGTYLHSITPPGKPALHIFDLA